MTADKLSAFRRSMQLCAQAHPYYRDLFQELGLTAASFQTPEELAALPLTDKAAWGARPEAFRLQLDRVDDVPLEEQTLWEVIYTTGSSARPTPFYDTVHDHYARMAQMKRMTELAGVRAEDVVANLFPLTSLPHQGFLSALYGPLGAGARVVSPLTGRGYREFVRGRATGEAVRFLERHRPTVLWGIATFVRRLIIQAQEHGADFSAVRLVFAMGEACPPGFRDDLRRRLRTLGAGDLVVQNGYGFTEMQGATYECREGAGFHVPLPDLFHFEILHSETLAPVPEGEPGLVVISHMNRRGTVLLRYQVGDVSALQTDPCPHCGRAGPRFVRPPVRVGGLVRIKGTLVNPQTLDAALSELQQVEEFACSVTKADPADPYSTDVLHIRIACAPEERDTLAARVRERVSSAIEITPQVECVDRDRLVGDDASYKFKRFVDHRVGVG